MTAVIVHQPSRSVNPRADEWLSLIQVSPCLTDSQKDLAELLAERMSSDMYVWLTEDLADDWGRFAEDLGELYRRWWLEPGERTAGSGFARGVIR